MNSVLFTTTGYSRCLCLNKYNVGSLIPVTLTTPCWAILYFNNKPTGMPLTALGTGQNIVVDVILSFHC